MGCSSTTIGGRREMGDTDRIFGQYGVTPGEPTLIRMCYNTFHSRAVSLHEQCGADLAIRKNAISEFRR